MLNIIWSNLAIDDVSDNIYYLEKNWTEKEVERFTDKTEEILEQLSKGNLNFKLTEHKNNGEHRLVYKISGTKGIDQKYFILQCRFHYDD